jgi:hypothetical protein
MPAIMTIDNTETTQTAVFGIEGNHAELASAEEIAEGVRVAKEVFEKNSADPLACALAVEKMETDQLLTREEALLCLIWDEAEDAAFRKVTLGWLSRDVDIKLKVTAAS